MTRRLLGGLPGARIALYRATVPTQGHRGGWNCLHNEARSRWRWALPTLRDFLDGQVTLSADRTATLILRVWLEDGSDAFRARLTSGDTSVSREGEELTVAIASSSGETVDAVRGWLADFLGRAAGPTDTGI